MKLWLPAASANAAEVDHLIWALLGVSLAVLALVFGLMFRYIVKYRAGSPFDRGAVAQKTWRIETAWTVGTLLVFFGLFVWGADLYVRLFQPPRDALKIYVIAKQWMWKVEHVGGQREINALHIPTGRPIELVMTSEDVIHDFSVPAFRLKHDVLPDRYETLWFTATRPGTYSLYCTQFCGLDHSKMMGEVVVLTPPEFQSWLGAEWRAPGPSRRRGKSCSCATAAAAVTAGTAPAGAMRKARCARRPFRGCTAPGAFVGRHRGDRG